MYKKHIYILIASITIYLVLMFVYNTVVVNKDVKQVYAINKDITKNTKINKEDVYKIKVNSKDKIYLDKLDDNVYATSNISKNTILLPTMIENNSNVTNGNEMVAIKINNTDDSVSNQVKKNNIVNIYYSAKISDMENILSFIDTNKEKIISNGYATIKLFENVEVINSFNKTGQDVNKVKENDLVDTILVDIPSKDVIKINNLKNYGKFSLSIVR